MVTSLAIATNGTRIITGGLDLRVNIFSLDSGDYRLIYSTKVGNSVLSLAISPDDACMDVGMGNLLSIYRRKPKVDLIILLNFLKIL
uniref:Uncharacterized protein n=1 Tax=Panagrolaimus davidi TaxID=227884 RepID=A0A914P0R8_9BILA